MEYFKSLFSSGFMPHGHCYLWKPEILWLHVISDAIIFIAYMLIPMLLSYIVYKSKYKIAFNHILILFCLFIVTCGTTHFMEIINVWKSEYFISGIIKAITAFCSIITAIAIFPHIPKIIDYISCNDEK